MVFFWCLLRNPRKEREKLTKNCVITCLESTVGHFDDLIIMLYCRRFISLFAKPLSIVTGVKAVTFARVYVVRCRLCT